MPNHVTNRVWITGDPVDVWSAIHLLADDDGVDFNRVLPMPDELHGEVSFNDVRAAKGEEAFGAVDREVVARLRDNLRKHGYAYWHDWAIANWGTKWNAYSQRQETRDVDMDNAGVIADQRMAQGDPTAKAFAEAAARGEQLDAVLVFQTAWSAPFPVLAAVSKASPDVTVHLEYADEDTGSNCGRGQWTGGERVYSWTPPTKSEAVRFSHLVCGDHPCDHWDDYFDDDLQPDGRRSLVTAALARDGARAAYAEAFYAAFDRYGWSWEQAHLAGVDAALLAHRTCA